MAVTPIYLNSKTASMIKNRNDFKCTSTSSTPAYYLWSNSNIAPSLSDTNWHTALGTSGNFYTDFDCNLSGTIYCHWKNSVYIASDMATINYVDSNFTQPSYKLEWNWPDDDAVSYLVCRNTNGVSNGSTPDIPNPASDVVFSIQKPQTQATKITYYDKSVIDNQAPNPPTWDTTPITNLGTGGASLSFKINADNGAKFSYSIMAVDEEGNYSDYSPDVDGAQIISDYKKDTPIGFKPIKILRSTTAGSERTQVAEIEFPANYTVGNVISYTDAVSGSTGPKDNAGPNKPVGSVALAKDDSATGDSSAYATVSWTVPTDVGTTYYYVIQNLDAHGNLSLASTEKSIQVVAGLDTTNTYELYSSFPSENTKLVTTTSTTFKHIGIDKIAPPVTGLSITSAVASYPDGLSSDKAHVTLSWQLPTTDAGGSTTSPSYYVKVYDKHRNVTTSDTFTASAGTNTITSSLYQQKILYKQGPTAPATWNEAGCGSVDIPDATTTSKEIVDISPTDCQWSFSVFLKDRAGNWSMPISKTITLDDRKGPQSPDGFTLTVASYV